MRSQEEENEEQEEEEEKDEEETGEEKEELGGQEGNPEALGSKQTVDGVGVPTTNKTRTTREGW